MIMWTIFAFLTSISIINHTLTWIKEEEPKIKIELSEVWEGSSQLFPNFFFEGGGLCGAALEKLLIHFFSSVYPQKAMIWRGELDQLRSYSLSSGLAPIIYFIQTNAGYARSLTQKFSFSKKRKLHIFEKIYIQKADLIWPLSWKVG